MRGDRSGLVPVEFGKKTATELVTKIIAPKLEFALQTCNERAHIIRDFTTDKQTIIEDIKPIFAQGDNDFTEHLLNPLTGILNVAKYGKYKKVAILYTDAWWYPLTNAELKSCIDTCSKYNIQFYAIIYTRPEAEPNGIKKSLKALADATGGKMYDGITTSSAAESIAKDLQSSMQANLPCEIEWLSEPSCELFNREITLAYKNATSNNSYYPPNQALVQLRINPNIIKFGQIPPGNKVSEEVTLTAENTDLTIKDIKLKYGATSYNIKNIALPYLLKKGIETKFSVEFSPLDSNIQYAVYEIETDYCSFTFSLTGGFPGKPFSGKTLKLTHPNGGEKFVVGSDSILKWIGISSAENVTLKFSNDKGATWQYLTETATGLKFPWKKIPGPASDQCLAQVIYGSEFQTPKIQWEKSFGGTDRDNASLILQAEDTGYLFVGSTYSTNGDVIGNHGIAGDIWAVKLDNTGTKEWSVCLGGNNFDTANNLIMTSDGGYLISGYTFSIDGYITNNHGDTDYWVVKLNSTGKIEWQNCYGGSNFDYCFVLQEVPANGYILGGITASNDGNVTGYHKQDDIWIVKIDNTGKIQWQKCLGGSNFENINSIIQTSDGYLVGGYTESADGDVVGSKGSWDYWAAKISTTGLLDWQKCFGGSGADYAYKMISCVDGGFILAGESSSEDKDVTGNHAGSEDIWVVKFDNSGKIQWEKSLGGSDKEHLRELYQTSDKGYIIISETYSNDGDIVGYHDFTDLWVAKLSSVGDFEWGKCLGGSQRESLSSSIQTYDDGIILAISTNSKDGDVIGSHGGWEIWLVKMSNRGNVEWQSAFGGTKDDYALSIKQEIEGGYVLAGSTNSKDGNITRYMGDTDAWIIKLSSEGSSQSDVSDTLFSIVEPKASSIDVDMKKCIVGAKRDTVIVDFVKNIGTYKVRIDAIHFTGPDKNAFILASGLPIYEIPPGDYHYSELLFVPNRVGMHNAKINIITQSDTLIYNIFGEGVAPAIQVKTKMLDFGVISVGNNRIFRDTALIRNLATYPITIDKVVQKGPNLTDFKVLKGDGNFSLQPGEERMLDLQFSPQRNGRTSGELAFYFNDNGSPAVTQLFGTGISGMLYMADDSAYAGEGRILQLGLANIVPDSLAKIASDFTAKIRFQSSILTLKNHTDFSFQNDSIIVNLRGKISTSNILADIPVIAGLGSAEQTGLDIVEFKLLDNLGNIVDYEFEKYPGTFKLLGICKDGGTRLINPNGKAGIQSIAPNPAGNSIDLEFSTSEIGYTEIAIYNTLGEKVLTAFSEDISETGKRNIKINSGEIGNGTYMVIFKSPTVVDTKQIMIVK
jgi:hypothetical protein